ncbi:hypothetical protein J3R30DRAFT_2591597 [Lentinula aciculospora]|uniref:Uncharacterized protein n=1 Tax=Lentinula aciculospora TaxID=153920 RepID=A0A9W9DQ13_9AGAR|nr:hypothetical protein J3R30DRAFT_2591597 [Lentinula aciculospora]
MVGESDLRFADPRSTDVADDVSNLNGFYPFYLSPFSSTIPSQSPLSRETELAALTQCIRSFEIELKSNHNFYDAQSTFISLGIAKQKILDKDIGLANIISDSFTWSNIDPADRDEEVMTDELDMHGPESGLPTTRNCDQPMMSASRRKSIAASKANKAMTHTPAPGKLRTSADIMNRLLWDPVLGKKE